MGQLLIASSQQPIAESQEDRDVNQLRILWWVPALLVAGACLLAQTGVPTALGQSATPAAVTAPAPDWTFVVHGTQDPYAGTLTTPPQPVPGMRYVGFDVEVVNDSDQPLSFAGTGVYLRDDQGFSYRSGTVGGREPALSGRTMPAGERARGWVWFEVPDDATLTEILLVPAAPELRVGLDQVANIPGTPGAAALTTDDAPSPAATATPPVTPAVTPPATELPQAVETSTPAPAAPQAPTSVITIEESAETPEEAESPTATPAATAPPAATSTPVPIVTPAIVMSAPTVTPPPAEGGIEPGTTVINADSDANLRAGPSLDAEIASTIPLGSELAVTGPAEAEGDALWWPVIVVATGEEGYVADELLTPLEE
jgi:hypothetical protein